MVGLEVVAPAMRRGSQRDVNGRVSFLGRHEVLEQSRDAGEGLALGEVFGLKLGLFGGEFGGGQREAGPVEENLLGLVFCG